MKKLFTIILLLVTLESDAKVAIQIVDPLLKVLPSSSLPPAFSFVQGAGINDNINMQVAMLSDEDAEVTLQLSSATLTNAQLSAFKKFKVEYIKVTNNVWNHGSDYINSPNGMYPDPLVPLTSYSLKKNSLLTVLLDAKTTNKFPVGVHKIYVTVYSLGKALAKTSFSFQLFKTVVPNIRMNYINWYHDVKYGMMNSGKTVLDFSPKYWRMFKNVVQVAKDYGQNSFAINPLFLTTFTKTANKFGYDFTNLNKAVNIILNEVKMDYVVARQFGVRMEGWNSEFSLQYPEFYSATEYMMKNKKLKDKETEAFYPAYLKAYYNNYKAQNTAPKILQHLADEPIDSNVQSYIDIAKMVKAIAPGLKIIEATITAKAFEYIDIIVVPFGEVPNLEKKLNEVRNNGKKQVWMYTSIHPQGDWANRLIEQPLLKTQLVPWIVDKYKFSGYLHWALNFWGENPYEEASFAPYNLPGGDPFIVYPGNQTINPSLRLVAVRNGLTDVAIFSLLKKSNPVEATRIANNLIKSYSSYNTNTSDYHQMKKHILTLLSR